jgi:PIN domain-containing protein
VSLGGREEMEEMEEILKLMQEKNIIIIFDTNIFLNLYSYSSNTIKNTLNLCETLNNSIWIPNRVSIELENNSKTIRENSFKKYDMMNLELQKILKNLENSMKTFFKSNKILELNELENLKKQSKEKTDAISGLFKNFKEDIKIEKNNNKKILSENKIDDFIKNLEVGVPYSITELIKIYSEGEIRLKYKIPPGYKDSDKGDSVKELGDFIIWKQILDKSKKEKKNILFVSEDNKEDWWKNDEIRPDLKIEFEEYTSNKIFFFKFNNFMDIANKSLTINHLPLETFFELHSKDILQMKIDYTDDIIYGLRELIEVSLLDEISESFDLYPDHCRIKNNNIIKLKPVQCQFEYLEDENVNYTVVLSLEGSFYLTLKETIIGKFNYATEINSNLTFTYTHVNGVTVLDEENVEIEYEDPILKLTEKIDYGLKICTRCNSAVAENEGPHGELICDVCLSEFFVCRSCGRGNEWGSGICNGCGSEMFD